MSIRPFGLSQLDVFALRLVYGSGKPISQSALAMMLFSHVRYSLDVNEIRSSIISTCSKGLLTWASWDDGYKWWGDRLMKVTPLGEEALRDSEIASGGDPNFYKYFNPEDSKSIERYSRKVSLNMGKKKILSKGDLFKNHVFNQQQPLAFG